MITQTDPRLVSSLKSSSRGASAITFLIGCLVLVGWMRDIATLKSILPIWVTMKANTALGFVLAGVSLWLLQREGTNQQARRTQRACAIAVTLIGLVTLVEYLFGWDLGIDQLLFREPEGAVGTFAPGRMAPNTALNFLLIGCSLLLLDVETQHPRRPAQILSLIATTSRKRPALL